MLIEIKTNYDNYECDLCGSDFAEGGTVKIDGKEVVKEPAAASCTDGTSYDQADLLVLALAKLGHEVRVDGDRWHITSYNESYHGKFEGY